MTDHIYSAWGSHGWGPFVGAGVGGAGVLVGSLHGMVTPDAITSYFTAIGFGVFGLANIAIIVYHRWQEARRDEYQRTQAIEREQYRLWVDAEILAIKARAGLSPLDSDPANRPASLERTPDMGTHGVMGSGGIRSLESPGGASGESPRGNGKQPSADGDQAADQ